MPPPAHSSSSKPAPALIPALQHTGSPLIAADEGIEVGRLSILLESTCLVVYICCKIAFPPPLSFLSCLIFEFSTETFLINSHSVTL